MHALSLRGFFFSDGADYPLVSALVLPQGVFGDLGNMSCMLRYIGLFVSDVLTRKVVRPGDASGGGKSLVLDRAETPMAFAARMA